jgi:hypothetical protein
MKNLLLGANNKRGSLFRMERATSLKIPSAFFKRQIFRNKVNNIDA